MSDATSAAQTPAMASRGAARGAAEWVTGIARDRPPRRPERYRPGNAGAAEKQIDSMIDLIQDAARRISGRYSHGHHKGITPAARDAFLRDIAGCHRRPDGPSGRAGAHPGTADRARPDTGPARPEQPGSPAMVGLDPGLRARVVRDLLLGEVGCGDRCPEAGLAGIDVDRVYVAFRARAQPGQPIEELVAELILSVLPHGDVLAAELDGDVIGLSPQAPRSVTAGVVGVGPAARPDELAGSFPLASRAMDAAIAFGLPGVHAFGDLGLLPAIVADTEVGEALWQRFVRPFDDVRYGAEIVSAIRAWFGCGMHVDRTAAQLAVHPNTLRNRIARFEDLTGADLHDAAAAMQVWWALHYAAPGLTGLTGNEPPRQPAGAGATA